MQKENVILEIIIQNTHKHRLKKAHEHGLTEHILVSA